MHQASNNDKGIIGYAMKYKSLIAANPDLVEDTLAIVTHLIGISARVVPLKSYFNLCQQIQRINYFTVALTNKQPIEEEKCDKDNIQDMANKLRGKSLEDIASLLGNDYNKFARESKQHICNEDSFIVACSYLNADIAKHGVVIYMSGRSPDLKDAKLHKIKINLEEGYELKKLSALLAKPDKRRGLIEQGQITSGYNYLAHLNNLHIIADEVAQWINEGEKTNCPPNNTEIKQKYGLTQTDLDSVYKIARRKGLISSWTKTRQSDNKYTLLKENHEKVRKYSEKFGNTPQKTLNTIVSDFFKLIENRQGYEKVRSTERINELKDIYINK